MSYHPGAASFEGVAKLIGNGTPPVFLATVLAEAAGGIALAARTQGDVPSADEVRNRLDQVNKAARVLARLLVEPNTLGRLDRAASRDEDEAHAVDLSGKREWLLDVAARASFARTAVQPDDGQKAWPQPEGLTAAEMCALIVARLWQAVRGKAVGPQSRKVWNACDAMWEACGQEPLGVDGGHWRRRLELAREMLGAPALARGSPPISPDAHWRQQALRQMDDLAERLTSYEQQEKRRERRAAAARAAQLQKPH